MLHLTFARDLVQEFFSEPTYGLKVSFVIRPVSCCTKATTLQLECFYRIYRDMHKFMLLCPIALFNFGLYHEMSGFLSKLEVGTIPFHFANQRLLGGFFFMVL